MTTANETTQPADEGRLEPTVRPQIVLPDMCKTHQTLLVRQCGYGPEDPWRALLIATQIALFQGATADPKAITPARSGPCTTCAATRRRRGLTTRARWTSTLPQTWRTPRPVSGHVAPNV